MRATYSFQNRIHDSETFQMLFQKGRRYVEQGICLLAYTKDSQSQQEPRLGFSLSKKVLKKSVQRKWMKRKVIECFRKRKSGLKGYTFVVFLLRSFQWKKSQIAVSAMLEKLFDFPLSRNESLEKGQLSFKINKTMRRV